jgi:predicted transcriptional regulator
MNLRQARKRARLGVRELGREAGVSKDTVSRIERQLLDPARVSHGDIVRLVYALRRAGLTSVTADDLCPIA